jgi:hypothetical protein
MAGETQADARTGKNGRRTLVGLLRQSVFGRLAGYEHMNDAERLRHDPAMRWIVGGKAAQDSAASPSQMGRFETQWLAEPFGSFRLIRPVDRPRPRSKTASRYRARYGLEREPNPRRTGELRYRSYVAFSAIRSEAPTAFVGA